MESTPNISVPLHLQVDLENAPWTSVCGGDGIVAIASNPVFVKKVSGQPANSVQVRPIMVSHLGTYQFTVT
jgi:hypothetical protein